MQFSAEAVAYLIITAFVGFFFGTMKDAMIARVKGEPKKSDTNPAGIPTSVCIRNGLDIERLKQDLDNLEDAQDLEMKRIETELYSHIHRLEKALEKGEENFTKIKIDIAKIEKHFAVLVAKLSIQMNQDSGHADN